MTEIDVKEEIEGLLRGDGRAGIEDLLATMQESGFYEAPASSGGGKHNAFAGGLAAHSLSVYWTASRIADALGAGEAVKKSLPVACLLHDLGKAGDFGKSLYVPNILKGGKVPTAKPWERNKGLTNIPHAIRSVIVAERWIDLTEDEEYAIMYHDGLYDRETGGFAVVQGHETKLLLILHWADMWSSRFEEKEGK